MRESVCPSFEWHKGQHNTARKRLRLLSSGDPAGQSVKPGAADGVPGRMAEGSHGPHDRIMSAHVRNYQRIVARLAS